MKPIPDNYENVLSAMQLMTLQIIEKRGWELYFVRRDGLDVPIPAVRSADGKTIGVIEEDGNLNTTPNIRIRLNPEMRVTP
jgi:hypothetical protein